MNNNKLVSKFNQFLENYMQRILFMVLRTMAPSLAFFFFLSRKDIKCAILSSCIVGILIFICDIVKVKKITNSSVIGGIALLFQIISSFLAGYEKLYYVPALLQNGVVMLLLIAMCVKKQSIFLYMVKDLKIALFESMKDQDVMDLNYIWIGYCLLKILSKVVGLVTLDFVTLYWIVFALGDPLNILLLVISYICVKRKVKKK